MAQSNKIETKDLRAKLIENLKQVTAITKKVDWANYKKAFNSMDDYIWIRISPKIHFAQPMGFSTREKDRGRSGAYQVYVNPNIPKQFQVPVEMHEWGHILYTHLTLPKVQRSVLINKIRSYWPEIKLHLSDEVLNKATNDPKYGDYICDRLCNCILNIAMDFEVNSKLFEDFEKDDLIQYLSIAGCYSLAYASESSVEGLERALRWTEYQLGIRVPKKGNKVTPLFMPCLPEDLGMPRGLEFEKYIDYMIIHDDEFFQYARNSLSNSTGLTGNPNTPQNQSDEDSGDEIDNDNSNPSSIGDSSDYGKEQSSGGSQQGGQGTSGNSNRPSLPELATEKCEHQIDKDGGGMEDWNPSNDEKNAQQQQQQQQGNQGSNGSNSNQQQNNQGSSSNNNQQGNQSPDGSSTGSNENQQEGQAGSEQGDKQGENQTGEQNGEQSENQNGQGANGESDQGESQDGKAGQKETGQGSKDDKNQSGAGAGNQEDGQNESQDGSQENGTGTGNSTDSLGRPIDDSHVSEDEMDANGKAPASSDLSNALNDDEDKNGEEGNGQGNGEGSGDKDGNSGKDGQKQGKLTPEQIESIIKAYDDGNLETNQDRIDSANESSNSGSLQGGYSPVGSNSNNASARTSSKEDIIEIGRTDKLEKFIVQRCFNKQHTDTRVDSMYYYNRRKFNSNRIITKKRTENRYKPGNVYLLVDVSGSVNEQAVSTIIQTVRKVANKCGHKSRVIFWDTELCGDYPLNNIGKVPCGGGTFMSDGIAYIREKYLHRSNDKLIIVSDFCDSLFHWTEEVRKLKGEAFGICWASNFDSDISDVKSYLQDNSFGSNDYSVIDNLLKDMPTIIVDISED